MVPFHSGGKEQRTHHVARHLAQWADVTVYTMKWWPGRERELTVDTVRMRAICPGLPLYKKGRRWIPQAIIFSLCTLRMLFARFDRLEVDSIPIFPLFPAKLVAFVRRTPLVTTWHELWGEQYWRDYLGGPAGRLAAWLERKAIRLPDHVIAASQHTADRLGPLLRPAQTLSVSRSGIDVKRIDAVHAAPAAVDACFVGRLLTHKRVDLLLEAVALLRAEGRDCSTVIVGNGPEADALRHQAERLGVDDLVTFRHDVTDQAELYALMKSARVFVFPSEREGFGIAVLEAMACGLSVVTTSAPDNAAQHLVTESGQGLVCAPDAAAIAAAVTSVLSADDAPDRQWLDGYGWPAVTAEIAAVLQCA